MSAIDDLPSAGLTQLPTQFGYFELDLIHVVNGTPHVVLVRDRDRSTVPLVRIHSACATGDLLGSLRCDCGPQLEASKRLLADEAHAFLFYCQQEGRGIGLAAKVRAYQLQDQGLDTVEANVALSLPPDAREYSFVASYLLNRSVRAVKLLSNNPDKCEALRSAGIHVERVPRPQRDQ